MKDKRAHIYYQGMVQGVGFRFTAERAAISLRLNGWIKNLDDGGVEVVCEGGEQGIKLFIEKMASIFNMSKYDIEWSGATGEFEGFDIRFD